MSTYNNITIEGAKIKYRNFAGRERGLNPSGRRNFCVVFDEETADVLRGDGWNIRMDKYGDEVMQVAVEYKNFPPRIVQISGNNKTVLTEKQVGLLDDAEIINVDLIIRPYNYNVNGKSGVKGYLKTAYITIQDDFGGKYADIPEVDTPSIFSDEMEEQANDIPF